MRNERRPRAWNLRRHMFMFACERNTGEKDPKPTIWQRCPLERIAPGYGAISVLHLRPRKRLLAEQRRCRRSLKISPSSRETRVALQLALPSSELAGFSSSAEAAAHTQIGLRDALALQADRLRQPQSRKDERRSKGIPARCLERRHSGAHGNNLALGYRRISQTARPPLPEMHGAAGSCIEIRRPGHD